ncbi:hypothetical protein BD413DRAFT_615059 [Trametes elegans]|nr:hypothetical protein BD413DRAFT_615059 [Trametes elegans]
MSSASNIAYATSSYSAASVGNSSSVALSDARVMHLNLGAMLVGCVIQAMFYGNSFLIVWRYFRRDKHGDPWWFRGAIAVAHVLCTFSVLLTVHGLWFCILESVYQEFRKPPWTIDFFLSVNSAIATLIRLLYVHRLWKPGSIEISVKLYLTSSAKRGNDDSLLKPIFYLIFATGLFADAILTGILCMWLRSARTGLKRTDSILNALIVYSLQTCLFPGLVETGGMIAFIVIPQSQIFIAFYLQIGVLYLSSLLTWLHTCRRAKQRMEQPVSFSINFSVLNDTASGAHTHHASSSDVSLTREARRHAPLESLDDPVDEKAQTPDIERPQEQLAVGLVSYAKNEVR